MSRTVREILFGFKGRPVIVKVYYALTVPLCTLVILNSRKIHPSYQLGLTAKLRLGARMFLNTLRIPTGTSYKTHLAMALKILETPPDVPGNVVECGTWKGGSAANLSLVCRVTGRKLDVYDSFQGLPTGEAGDRAASQYRPGDYRGAVSEVQRNIDRYGAPECCQLIQGWFSETLPQLNSAVLLAFLDVDLEASLETCVRYIWPYLAESGFVFIDEAVDTNYCSLFYSERWWKENFQSTPPGLIGAGVGLALGEFYIGPWSDTPLHPLQHHNAGAYTSKSYSGYWSYYPG